MFHPTASAALALLLAAIAQAARPWFEIKTCLLAVGSETGGGLLPLYMDGLVRWTTLTGLLAFTGLAFLPAALLTWLLGAGASKTKDFTRGSIAQGELRDDTGV